jgi:cytidylate kinase
MKKHIITIAGKPGSGKSTTAKLLAEQLQFTHYSTGDFFRQIGKEMGLDVLATNKAAVDAAEIDHRVDERQKSLGQTEDNFVIDARLGWFFIPESFKVYLDLDLEIAAKRILDNMDPARLVSEQLPGTPAEYADVLRERLDSESGRYMNLYGVDPSDLKNYDLVIDTGSDSPEQISKAIQIAFGEWLNS